MDPQKFSLLLIIYYEWCFMILTQKYSRCLIVDYSIGKELIHYIFLKSGKYCTYRLQLQVLVEEEISKPVQMEGIADNLTLSQSIGAKVPLVR